MAFNNNEQNYVATNSRILDIIGVKFFDDLNRNNITVFRSVAWLHAQILYDYFKDQINAHPHQRFGQIFCNYIYPDYRSRSNRYLNRVQDLLFYKTKCDPFYEDPKITLKRMECLYHGEF